MKFKIKIPLGGYLNFYIAENVDAIQEFAAQNHIMIERDDFDGLFVHHPDAGQLWVFLVVPKGKAVDIPVLSHELIHAVYGSLEFYGIKSRDQELIATLQGIYLEKALKKLRKLKMI